MRTFLFLSVALWGSIGYTGEWVASVPVAPAPPPLVVETPVPTVTYAVPQPTVVYGWTPYYYTVPVITERRCWFLRRERKITYSPQIFWHRTASLYYGY
jgi:hypothetical protein